MRQKTFISGRYRPVFLMMICALVATISTSCLDNGDEYSVLELGAAQKEYVVPAKGGVELVNVFANKAYDISLPKETLWAHINVAKMQGDGSIEVKYDANDGFPRMTPMILKAGNRVDTVFIKQEGLSDPEIKFDGGSMTVKGAGGQVTANLNTNLKLEQMTVKINYTSADEGNWIKDIAVADGKFTFTTDNNPQQIKLRTANISLSYIDGWRRLITQTLFLTQANAKEEFGREVSIQDIRNMAGSKVMEDIFVNGVVVSDKGNMNVNENPNLTDVKIDYSNNDRTVFIQSEDGSKGIMLMTKTTDDNTFKRYSKVQILLRGTSIVKTTDPKHGLNCYSVEGITANMVMSAVDGTAAVLPLKERTMATLTDDDIYTYVTLKDCEIPIRKGSLTPFNEGYTLAYKAQRVDKYPMVIRDKEGSSMHLMTNVKCPYRRDGSEMPQGSGTISGIIVHEQFYRFDGDGDIGRYQIRHLTREEIALAPSFDSGFSAMIAEWKEYKINNDQPKIILPTSGVGEITHTNILQDPPANPKGDHYPIQPSVDYYLLGPIVGDQKIDFKGKVETSEAGTHAFANSYWWNYEKDRGESWVIKFATNGISTDQLSMQIGVMNVAVGEAPRYWVAEWSTHGDQEGEWQKIAEYTVPDIVNWGKTLLTQLNGTKYISMKLPLEMLNKDNVFVRLKVARNVAGTSMTYDGEKIVNGKSSQLVYVGIRYNK